jgi:hypothetical protein
VGTVVVVLVVVLVDVLVVVLVEVLVVVATVSTEADSAVLQPAVMSATARSRAARGE